MATRTSDFPFTIMGCGRTPPSAYPAEESRLHLCGLPLMWEPTGETVYQSNQERMVQQLLR